MSAWVRGHHCPKLAGVLLLGGLLCACATNIQDRNDTIVRSTKPFGGFPTVIMRPLVVEKMEGDAGDQAAVRHIVMTLRQCMMAAFPKMIVTFDVAAPAMEGQTLLIEPAIVDLKKVSGAERFWLGATAGSSAALLRMRLTDANTKAVLAEPIFYGKANAWGGAFSFGGTDNAMLSRLTNEACSYSRNNM